MAFSKSDVRYAVYQLEGAIKRYFGDIWAPPSEAPYKGKAWDCHSILSMDRGLWYLCQTVKHTGARRAFGKVELKDAGDTIRFIIFYDYEREALQ